MHHLHCKLDERLTSIKLTSVNWECEVLYSTAVSYCNLHVLYEPNRCCYLDQSSSVNSSIQSKTDAYDDDDDDVYDDDDDTYDCKSNLVVSILTISSTW